MPTALRTTATVLSLATTLAAQTLVSGGPLAGSAVAIAVDGGSAGGADASTLVHRNGFVGSPAAFPAGPSTTNLQEILGLPALDVDDFSAGRDDVLFDTSGVVDVPTFAWGMITFSVKNGAAGRPNSRLSAEVAEAAAMVPSQSVGAHVFSWILPGSDVPLPLRGAVHRSHSRRELGLPIAGTATPEVDALDTPIVLGIDQATLSSTPEPGFGPFVFPNAIYFTVANASVATVTASHPTWWLTQGGASTPPSGASILVVQRSAGQGQWTPPRVWKSCVQLGLSPSEDIDALAIDISNEKILFSCVGTLRDQFQFLYYGTDGGPPVPATLPGGTSVSQAVGTAHNDEVDAVCTLDPQIRTNGGWIPDDFGASCAAPRDAYLPGTYPVGMSASAFRRYEGGVRHYDTWMLGFPPPAAVPGPGLAVLVLTIGDLTSPAITATVQARVPASSIPGDPRSYTVDIPPAFSLIGFPLMFRWWAFDSTTGQLAQAYPVKAFL